MQALLPRYQLTTPNVDTMVKSIFLHDYEVLAVDYGMQVHEHREELSKAGEGRKRRSRPDPGASTQEVY